MKLEVVWPLELQQVQNILEIRKNKRGEIGETFTWIAAFLLIFFIIVLFLTFSLIVSGAKGGVIKNFFISDDGEIKFSGQDPNYLLDLSYFLNSDSQKIYNLLKGVNLSYENLSNQNVFVIACMQYLQKNYPVDTIGFYEANMRLEYFNTASNKYETVHGYSCTLADSSEEQSSILRYGLEQMAKKRVDLKTPIYSNKRLILEVIK